MAGGAAVDGRAPPEADLAGILSQSWLKQLTLHSMTSSARARRVPPIE
jgi:hypothetical protein